jgi:hypothetical protein
MTRSQHGLTAVASLRNPPPQAGLLQGTDEALAG